MSAEKKYIRPADSYLHVEFCIFGRLVVVSDIGKQVSDTVFVTLASEKVVFMTFAWK